MKSMKKSLVFVLIFVLAISMALVGCGNNNNENNSNNNENAANTPANTNTNEPASTNENTAEPAPANDGGIDVSKLEPYELRMVFPGAPQKDAQAIQDKMNEYLKEKINASIKIEPVQWGQWDNKVNLMITSREKVDIFFTAQWTNYAINANKGAFIALNDDGGKYGNLLAKYGQGITASITPEILKGSQLDGKNYAVPTLKEMASQGGIIYRQDIAQELGIDQDLLNATSPADLMPILEKVKAGKPDYTPLFLRDGENFNSHYFANFDYLGDGNIEGVIFKDGEETTVKSRFELDRYKDNLKLAREMFTKGLVNKDAATTQLSTQDAMKSGKVFMTVQPLKPGKDAELAAATGLTGKLKQVALNTKTTATSETAGSMLAISSTSGDPERAMMFINLLHSDAYLNNLLNFGIEGTHFAKVSDTMIETTDRTGDYSPGASWMFGSQFLNYIWKGEPEDKWDQFKAFNEGSHNSKGIGFTFNADDAKIKTKVAAMLTIRKQYDPALDTGSIDPDKTLPEYEKKMKASGMEDVIKEKQKQFDEFLAKQ